jgi:hypothetical protein
VWVSQRDGMLARSVQLVGANIVGGAESSGAWGIPL